MSGYPHLTVACDVPPVAQRLDHEAEIVRYDELYTHDVTRRQPPALAQTKQDGEILQKNKSRVSDQHPSFRSEYG